MWGHAWATQQQGTPQEAIVNRCGCCRKPLKDEQEFRWELCKDCQSVIAHLDQEVGVPASAGLKV